MVRSLSDRLRRLEIRLLVAGALSSAALLLWNVRTDIAFIAERSQGLLPWVIFALKLLMLESALLAPYVILAMLSRALLRETQRARYRFAGLGLSVAACIGVAGMLWGGMVRVHLENPVDALIGEAIPALILLTVCAALYGGLVFLAQRSVLEPFKAAAEQPAIRSRQPE